MLDQLRAMGVFACVVKHGSFSKAAKELGITTSAVSQQIRSLEKDLDIVLLYRSTRKINLTKAGRSLFQSCCDMMAAAERGRIRVAELQDELTGELHITTTSELALLHVIPALSQWILAQTLLRVYIHDEYRLNHLDQCQLPQHEGSDSVDIIITINPEIEQRLDFEYYDLARVPQIIVASPDYLDEHEPILYPEDLYQHELLSMDFQQQTEMLKFVHNENKMDECEVTMPIRLVSNHLAVIKSLCQHGHGIAKVSHLEVEAELRQQQLVQILPDWNLGEQILYAIVPKYDDVQKQTKAQRCVQILKIYFAHLPVLEGMIRV